jgi:hypothetical protein
MLANICGPGNSWKNQPLAAGSGASYFRKSPTLARVLSVNLPWVAGDIKILKLWCATTI